MPKPGSTPGLLRRTAKGACAPFAVGIEAEVMAVVRWLSAYFFCGW